MIVVGTVFVVSIEGCEEITCGNVPRPVDTTLGPEHCQRIVMSSKTGVGKPGVYEKIGLNI